MNLKIPLLLFVIFCFSQHVNSQTLSNRVIATGGSFSTASWGSLSATIGEASITTLTSSTVSLLQGFQQPTSGFAGITAVTTKIITANVYPNPSKNDVYLEVTLPEMTNITYKVFDLNGKELYSGNFNADALHTTTEKLDFSRFSNGMYLITLYSNDERLQNFKIQINR